jgi:hypothetical protein
LFGLSFGRLSDLEMGSAGPAAPHHSGCTCPMKDIAIKDVVE